MRVLMRTRSVVSNPKRSASSGWIHTGFVFESSYSHFELPERVWINVGRRNVGMSTYSPFDTSIVLRWMWLSMYAGSAYSGQPHSAIVLL